MNKYLMQITGYFTGFSQFIVEAENKIDAVIKAREFCKRNSVYGIGGNYDASSIKCIKKLKTKG